MKNQNANYRSISDSNLVLSCLPSHSQLFSLQYKQIVRDDSDLNKS